MTAKEPWIAQRRWSQDAAFPCLIFAGAAVFYGLTWRSSLFDDGEVFSHYFVASDTQVWYHLLYLPAARGLHALLAPLGIEDHLAGLKGLSIVSAAFGLAMSWCAARALGCARGSTALAVALFLLSPCLWFFGTTIELHATHFASVAFAAAGTLAARRLPFAWHLLVTALLFPLLYLTHNSGALFGLGWVWLFCRARAVEGHSIRFRTAVFVVGPILLASLLLTIACGQALRGRGFGLALGSTFDYIDAWHASRVVDLDFLWNELIVAEAWLWLPALLALVMRRVPRAEGLTWLLAALPVTGFFLWFAFPSRGGYFSGVAFFLFLVAARCPLPRPPAVAILVSVGLIAAQAYVGSRELQRYEARFADVGEGEERARAVRIAIAPRLGARRAALLAFEPQARPIQVALPGFVEIPLHHAVPAFLGPPPAVAAFSEPFCRQIEEHLLSGEWLVCYERAADSTKASWPEVLRVLIDGFEAELQTRFEVEAITQEERVFWLLSLPD